MGEDGSAIAFGERWEYECLRQATPTHSGKDRSANAYGRLRQRILREDGSANAYGRLRQRFLGRKGRSYFGKDGSAIAVKAVYNRLKIKSISIESMPTYNEVLNQVQSLSISEQVRLSEELKNLLDRGVEVEGDDEMISVEEITESEAAWENYVAGRDRGNSLKEIELELFGRELD